MLVMFGTRVTVLCFLILVLSCHYRVIAYGEIDDKAVQKVLEKTIALRELKPIYPIKTQLLSPRALDEELKNEFDRFAQTGFYTRYNEALEAIGFLPPQTDYQEISRSLYSSATGGYYDAQKKTLRIISRPYFRSEFTEIVGFLKGRDPLFGELLSHEISHALVDQNFDLQAFLQDGETDEDILLSRRAAAEGDAWLIGYLYQGGKLAQFGPRTQSMIRRAQVIAPSKDAPWPIRASFLFPYLQGGLFVDAVLKKGGIDALNRVYQDPPRGTTEIMHPERYLEGKRLRVRRPDLTPLYDYWDNSYRLLMEDTMGEYRLLLLLGRFLEKKQAYHAAKGWSGDRFAVIKKEGLLAFVLWATAWESSEEAQEFFSTMIEWLSRRYPVHSFEEKTEDKVLLSHQDGFLGIWRQGDQVVLVNNVLPGNREFLLQKLLKTIPQ